MQNGPQGATSAYRLPPTAYRLPPTAYCILTCLAQLGGGPSRVLRIQDRRHDRDAGGACLYHRTGLTCANTADGDHWNVHGLDGLSQRGDTTGRLVRMRGCRKDVAKGDPIGALGLDLHRALDAVNRDANTEVANKLA